MQSIIEEGAEVGAGTSVGVGCHIYSNASIGEGSVIGDYCIIGHPSKNGGSARATIGPGALIRSHTIVYSGVSIGPQLETGHHCVIRERTVSGVNLRIGNYTDLEGDCELGDYVRLHGYVHIGKGTRIGSFTWIFSLSTCMNDPLPPSHASAPVRIGHMAVVCVGCNLLPGSDIADGAYIASGATVHGRVPRGVAIDRNGHHIGPTAMLMSPEHGIRHPWPRHFSDAYPKEAQAQLEKLARDIFPGVPMNAKEQR